MAYNEHLADQVSQHLHQRHIDFEEKKMMGGLCFMIDSKMCLGISNDQLMVRLDPEIYEECLTKEGCHEMNFTGRPMKGFVFVDAEVLEDTDVLAYWVGLRLEFNPKTRRSR